MSPSFINPEYQILDFLEQDFTRVHTDYGVTREEFDEMLKKAYKYFSIENISYCTRLKLCDALLEWYKPYQNAWRARYEQKKIEATYDYQI